MLQYTCLSMFWQSFWLPTVSLLLVSDSSYCSFVFFISKVFCRSVFFKPKVFMTSFERLSYCLSFTTYDWFYICRLSSYLSYSYSLCYWRNLILDDGVEDYFLPCFLEKLFLFRFEFFIAYKESMYPLFYYSSRIQIFCFFYGLDYIGFAVLNFSLN